MSKLSDDAVTYLKDHNISQLMEHILRNLVTDLPENPRQYIQEMMSRPIPPQIIIAGPPGSGKGTQCRAVCEKFGLIHVSSGDLLRAEVQAGSDVGKMADSFMRSGELVPDKLIIGIIRRRLNEEDARSQGWLLDGFPRSREQAEVLEEAGVAPHAFILLEVPDEVVVERLEHRRTDPATGAVYHLLYNPPPAEDVALCERLLQREDDHRETVEARLKIYHDRLIGLQAHYGKMIETVDGNKSIKEVTETVIEAVERRILK